MGTHDENLRAHGHQGSVNVPDFAVWRARAKAEWLEKVFIAYASAGEKALGVAAMITERESLDQVWEVIERVRYQVPDNVPFSSQTADTAPPLPSLVDAQASVAAAAK